MSASSTSELQWSTMAWFNLDVVLHEDRPARYKCRRHPRSAWTCTYTPSISTSTMHIINHCSLKRSAQEHDVFTYNKLISLVGARGSIKVSNLDIVPFIELIAWRQTYHAGHELRPSKRCYFCISLFQSRKRSHDVHRLLLHHIAGAMDPWGGFVAGSNSSPTDWLKIALFSFGNQLKIGPNSRRRRKATFFRQGEEGDLCGRERGSWSRYFLDGSLVHYSTSVFMTERGLRAFWSFLFHRRFYLYTGA